MELENAQSPALRRTVLLVALLNCAYFGVEFAVAFAIGSVSLFADSVDRKVRILNLGFAGYGPHQFLSELQAGIFDSVIAPQPKLFVFVTAAWHAERSSCRSRYGLNGPRYKIENGQLLLKGVCHEGLALRIDEGTAWRLVGGLRGSRFWSIWRYKAPETIAFTAPIWPTQMPSRAALPMVPSTG